MRRPALIALLALLTTAAVPALAAGRRAGPAGGGWTSYSVTLFPLTAQANGCAAGVEGVEISTRTLRSPRAGQLQVRMRDLPGDFDVLLFDAAGRAVGNGGQGDQSMGPSTTEQAFVRVRPGTSIRMVVCNYSSPVPRATVEYRFVGERAATPVARGYRSLRPGGLPDLQERVPVNIVLAGFPGVSEQAVRAHLPKINRPHERVPSFYGIDKPLGITYRYDYRFTRPSANWQDRFFGELTRLGRHHRTTDYQDQYNTQARRHATVRDVLAIDASAVERWLALHAPAGVDTTQDTVFLLNWYGRKDFRFHFSQHANEPVSGTGYATGKSDFRALQAWGGSTPDDPESGLGSVRRVWFDDLSAGPDYWTGSYTLARDIDGDGLNDRHVVPAWDYGHAVPREQLAEDLGLLVRYVAVDLLFTTSPLYGLRSQGDVLPGSVDIDMNVYDMDPNSHDVSYLPSVVAKADRGVSPLLRTSSDLEVRNGTDPEHLACFAHYQAFAQLPVYTSAPACDPRYAYSAYDDLWAYAASHLSSFLDDSGRVDREVPVFSYQLPEQLTPCFAYADDDHATGTPSMVFGMLPTNCRYWYGSTDIYTHESGHEIGMSHPHDGYDYEQDLDLGAYGDTYLAAVGDESSTVMSYLNVNNEYSQFDRDNYARWTTAAHLAAVNDIAAKVLGRPGSAPALHRADALAVQAAEAFLHHDAQRAASLARQAWQQAMTAARGSGVAITPSYAGTQPATRLSSAMPKGRGYSRGHVIDPSTGLPLRCVACAGGVPAFLLDRPGR